MRFLLPVLLSFTFIGCDTAIPDELVPAPTPEISIVIPDDLPPEPDPLPGPPPKIKPLPPIGPVEKRLKKYLARREIKPLVTLDTYDPEYIENGQRKFVIGKHKIALIIKNNETAIKINGDLITLKDKVSLNPLWDEAGESDRVDFADKLEQAKLYKFGGRELIAIGLGNTPCTGIGCRIAFFLIYDLKTKTSSFFGTYRIDREVRLYDFRNDGTLDFLSGTYIGGSEGIGGELQNLHHLYTMDANGNFRLQKNKNAKPYYIKRIFTADDYIEIDRKFKQNWIEEIK